MLNKVQLIGNLGNDPEAKDLQNGGRVVNFRLATTERWKDKNGEKQERTEWHSIVIWNEKIGEIAEKYLRKGSKCYVEGKLQTRKWQDKDGNDRYSTEVVLAAYSGQIELLDSKNGNGDRQDDDREERRQSRDRNRDDEPRSRSNGKSRDSESSQRRSRDRDDEPRQRDQRGGRAFDDEIPF